LSANRFPQNAAKLRVTVSYRHAAWSMTMIAEHEYMNGVLRYLLVTDDREFWVSAEDMTDASLIRDYWARVTKTRTAKLPPLAITKAYIPRPTRIIDVRTYDNVEHLECLFANFNAPVLVRLATARNAWPQMVIQFFERRIQEA
jgi:hypothetical protein